MSNNSKKDVGKKEETTIQNIKTGQERAFYGSKNVHFKNIIIDGIEQGESAFKECRNISIEDTNIVLKYCVWHCHNITLYKSIIDVNSRASIWYCENMEIVNCKLNGIKVCRNCSNLTIKDSVINSDDFGWMCEGVKLINCKISGVTPLLHSSNITIDGTDFKIDGERNFFYFIINLIFSVIIELFGLVYNELFILSCCELSEDTHHGITERSLSTQIELDTNVVEDDEDNI